MTTDDHRTEFAAAVRAFARDRLAAGALERAHSHGYPWDAAKLLADQSLLGLTVPERDGGQGGTLLDAVTAIQEVGMVCPKSADVVQAGNFGALRTFAEYASDEQKARFLPGLLAGTALLGLAMSEPEAGSAVTDLTTSATPEGDGYVVDGTKIWSTHSVEATVYLVYVRFGPGVSGIGSVLVERGTPGLEIGRPSTYMSGEEWAELRFDACRIPLRERAARAGRVQTADQRLQRGAPWQRRPLARAGPPCVHDRARARAGPSAVRSPAGGVPGHPMEVRRHGSRA